MVIGLNTINSNTVSINNKLLGVMASYLNKTLVDLGYDLHYN